MMDKCKNCGGGLEFSPKNKGNKCVNCGTVYEIAFETGFSKKDVAENTIKLDLKNSELSQGKCSSCGGSVIFGRRGLKAECPYCGSATLLVEKRAETMNVDSIVPFNYSKEEAIVKFKEVVNKNFFADKRIFNNITDNDIKGIYINAFVFDFTTSTNYHGVFSYQTTVKDKNGRTETKTIRKVVSGTFNKNFDNITIEANSNLTQYDLRSIEPFNYDSAVKYSDDFMHGYLLEYQDTMFEDCIEIAKNSMKTKIKQELLKKHGCTRIESLDMSTTYPSQKYNYCLLPVYFVNTQNYKNGEKHRALMNGQTGKVGNLPLNKLKVWLTVLFACGITVAIIIAVLLFVI